MKLPWKDECKRNRMQRGYTQAEFADLLGVSKRTIEQWEAGNRTPRKCTYMGIELILQENSSTSEILTEAAEPEPQPAALETPQEQMLQRIKKDLLTDREPEEFEVELSVIGYYLDDALKNHDNNMIGEAISDLEEIIEKIAEMQFTS